MTAANKAIELGRARIANSYDYFLGQQDWAGAARSLQDGHTAGIYSTPEYDRAMIDLGQRKQHAETLEDMTANPRKWAESNPIDKPPAGYSQEKWWGMHDHARTLSRREDTETTDQVVDDVLTGKISTPEEIAAATPHMRPGARLKLQNFLTDYHDSAAKALRETPEFQHEVVGRVSELLKEYNPELADYDENYVEMATQVEQLPAGPVREELTRRLTAARDGAKVEIKTRKDLAMQEIDVLAEAGNFGRVAPARKIEVREKVKDGFLKDTGKLRKLGFDEDQAEAIREAAREGPAQGQKKLQELWKLRPEGSVQADPFDITLAEAIKNGDGTMNWEMDGEDARMAAEKADMLRAKGKAITELEEWFKVNPDAPEAAIMGKLREMGSKAARLTPPGGVVKPAPGRKIDPSTSMNIPAPLKPLAPVFEAEGRKHGLDPRLLMAISMHETANGTSSAYRNKRNAMGVSDAKGPIAFEDPAESVARMARVLASDKGPYRNARTLAEIGRIYAPPGAGNDPRGLNGYWTAGVSKYLRQLGGDPDKIFLNS
jgi:hypothetical protein